MKNLLSVIFTMLACCLCTGAWAQVVVTNNSSSGAGSLRQAIADANDGETITFSDAVTKAIVINSQIVINKNVTIDGGVNKVTIKVPITYEKSDQNSPSSASKFRVFEVSNKAKVKLTRLNLQGGEILQRDPTLKTIDNNGGVIFVNSNCELTLDSVSVSEARANEGGGICNNGMMMVTNSTINNNRSAIVNYGGGICNNGTMTVTNSTIKDNIALYCAGIYNSGMATITNSIIDNNEAGGDYGGIRNHGTMTVTNSIISNNIADNDAGIYNEATLTVTNSIISNNKNRVGLTGREIYNIDGNISIYNSIIWGNGIFLKEGTLSIQYSLVEGLDLSTYTDHNMNTDPFFINASKNDFHLQAKSPAINAGSDALYTGALATDKDLGGNPRKYGTSIDMGAYEYTPSSDATLSDLKVNSTTITGFAPTTFSYAVTVPYSTASIPIAATANDMNATVKGDIGTQSLTVGDNTFTITVTAENPIYTQDYVIVVHRQSNDATLSNLTVSAGTLTPVFAPGTYSYSVTVGNDVDKITLTPTKKDAGATVTAQTQSLAVGDNAFIVTVTAEDKNYTQPYTVNVIRRAKVSLDDLDINIPSKTYDGLQATAATVVPKQTTTGLGMISNIKYGNSSTPPTNAGTYSVTADIDEGTYYDAVSNFVLGNFIIAQKAINDASVSVTIADQSYTGSALKPEPEIKDGSTLLVKDVDYTLSYDNNINVGTATITITGKGNYTGTREVKFTITQKTITSVTVNTIANPIYTGSAFKPVPVVSDNGVTLTENVDYTLSYSNNTNAGTAKITITGKGKYSGTKDVTFTITAKAINEASVTVGVLSSQTYTGAAFTLQPEVKDGTTVLVKDRDYTLSYSNNVNAGTATVTITGKGNYCSLRTETFTINRTAAVAPAPVSLPEGLEATYGDRFSSVTLPAGFRWPSPSSTVSNASSYPVTVRALYNLDPRNYEDYEVELFLTIHQAQPPAQVVFPETTPEAGTTAPVYDPDGTLSNIGLPNGTGSGTFSWRYPNTVPTVGKTEYEVVFTPSDASNYDYSNVPGWNSRTRTIIRTVTLTIIPRDIEVTVEANPTYTYTGLPITITATVTVSSLRSSQVTPVLEYLYYRNGQVQNEAVNAGQYEVIARSADVNYKGESAPVSFTIEKVQPVIVVNDTVANYTGNPVQIAYELTGSYTASGLSQTLKFTYEGVNGTVYNLTEKAPTEIGDYRVHISTPGSVNHLPAEADASLKIISGSSTDLKDLKDFKDFKDFKVYPNPVSKNSKLVLESGQWTMDNAEVWVEVYNTGGNLLQRTPITQKQTELRSESKEGIYLYILKSKAGVLGTTKIVVK